MQRLIKSLPQLILAALILTACNLPFGSSLSEADAVRTSAAKTVEVLRTEAASSSVGAVTLPPINTLTPLSPVTPPTQMPQPSFTPPNTLIPSKVPTATLQPTSTFVPIPCDRADFVADATIPDNTYIAPGTTFTKTWTLKNSGSCTWTTAYALVFASGEQMGGQTLTNLPGNVLPGQTINLSVSLTAPSSAGAHQGYWRLQNAGGGAFGWGINGDQAFWVLINSGSSASTGTTSSSGFAVTSVTIDVSPKTLTTTQANCAAGVNYVYTANITASAAGTVTYEWRKTDGTVMASDSLEYKSAGTQEVTYNYSYVQTGIGSFASQLVLYINKPNHQTFATGGTFTLTCN
ncbi:NBR1-Ig-like domain-containing protein [Leptolinea tardivitalis]|uniref:Nbr1 FW domain-containing protein n=1 Tax=Leptolinea tardivitalis TaxID=229920 RepID=A0A0P6WMM5_9CHLR|nr:NBR1-Ig-like domain-containing protein [Leptolinea tardivitalis]KPL71149.1 hypothetical protein ADM99_12875 [Leptolinea tardivitalis]GAP22585.1 hypothetical protein LTAR_02819 [Leptolinea tardivitalis]